MSILLMGDFNKKPLFNELKFCRRFSIYSKKKKKKLSKINAKTFEIIQPQAGIPAKYLDKIEGMKLRKNLKPGSVLRWQDVF